MKAFRNVRKVEMVEIPALKKLILRFAFVDVKELKMENASLLENHEKLGVIKRKQDEEAERRRREEEERKRREEERQRTEEERRKKEEEERKRREEEERKRREEKKRRREEEERKRKEEEEKERLRREEEERKRKEQELKEMRERREKGIVLNAEDLESLSVELRSIDVKKCDDYQNEVLDLSHFTELEALTIGDGCFNYVSKVSVVGLKKLKSVAIGAKSFQNESNDSELIVSDCPELVSLSVGNESFKGFKEMKLSGLDGLKRVTMGGYCFKNAELRVSGLKGLGILSLGAGCFEKSLHSVIEGERGCVV